MHDYHPGYRIKLNIIRLAVSKPVRPNKLAFVLFYPIAISDRSLMKYAV